MHNKVILFLIFMADSTNLANTVFKLIKREIVMKKENVRISYKHGSILQNTKPFRVPFLP